MHGACEQAVKLASADELPGFRDSRGLARALTGDVQGALEDFKAFVAANTGRNIEERKIWIKRLEVGEAPAAIFDVTTLEKLKRE